MIKPTIGRVVWYFGGKELLHLQPLAAIVCHVESDTKINLVVFGAKGECFPRERVSLVQDIDEAKASDNLPDGELCTWMPFQKAQSDKPPLNAEQVATQVQTMVAELFIARESAGLPLGVQTALGQISTEVSQLLESYDASKKLWSDRIAALESSLKLVNDRLDVSLPSEGQKPPVSPKVDGVVGSPGTVKQVTK